MKKLIFVCKYCGKAITVNSNLEGKGSSLVALVDHIIIQHRDKIEEIGAIYLSDIPKECYEVKEV